MLTKCISRRENSKIEIRNNTKIQMIKIQNKCGMVLSLCVYVIEISII